MPIIQELLDDLQKMAEIHRKKNDDYASTTNPFSNFDVSTFMLSQFNNPRDQSFVWPIATKLARLSTLLNSQKEPNNESIGDSLLDISIYCLLWKADLGRRIKDSKQDNKTALTFRGIPIHICTKAPKTPNLTLLDRQVLQQTNMCPFCFESLNLDERIKDSNSNSSQQESDSSV